MSHTVSVEKDLSNMQIYLPVYAGIVEKIEGVSLRVHRSIISGSVHNFSLWHACLQQRVVYRHRYAIFTAVD